MSTKRDYYEVLGVLTRASEQDLRDAYLQLAFEYHPDRNPGNVKVENAFRELSEAWSVLSDPVKRRAYDEGGHARADAVNEQSPSPKLTEKEAMSIVDWFFRKFSNG